MKKVLVGLMLVCGAMSAIAADFNRDEWTVKNSDGDKYTLLPGTIQDEGVNIHNVHVWAAVAEYESANGSMHGRFRIVVSGCNEKTGKIVLTDMQGNIIKLNGQEVLDWDAVVASSGQGRVYDMLAAGMCAVWVNSRQATQPKPQPLRDATPSEMKM